MSTKEGRNQDDAVESGKPSESSLTDLLHGFRDHDKKRGRARLKRSLSPILIAALCLSVVLLIEIYKIGVQGFSLREKVHELAQENAQLAETLKSMGEGAHYSDQEPKSEPSMPAKSASEKPRPVRKRTSAKPSKISKIMYRVKDGDSLSQISERFGVSVEQLRSWNSIDRSDLLLVGRVLIINKTMTTDDLPYLAQDGRRDKVAEMENEGSGTTAGRRKLSEFSARGETDNISNAKTLEQIAEVRAEAEAAKKAIVQLQGKLDSERKKSEQTIAMLREEVQKRKALEEKLATDYISKQTALEQINEAAAKAEAANKAIAEYQAKLDSERKEHGQRVAMLEQEVQRRKALEEKLATDYISKEKALEQIAEVRTEAEATKKAIVQLQGKFDSERKKSEQTIAMLQTEVQERKSLEQEFATDYISKERALEQIAEVRAEAEAANRAVSELQTKLDSERKEYEQTVERLEEVAEKGNNLEEESVTEKVHARPNATTGKAIGKQPTAAVETGEYSPTEGQETSTGKPVKETVHVIREGENLFRIGIKHGISWKTLLKFNNLADANAIYVGQKIRIPKREKTEARPTSLDER